MARVEKGCSSANSGHWSSPLFLSYTALPSSAEGEIEESCAGSDAGWTCSSSTASDPAPSIAHRCQAQVRPSLAPPPAPPRARRTNSWLSPLLRSSFHACCPPTAAPACVCVFRKARTRTHTGPLCARLCARWGPSGRAGCPRLGGVPSAALTLIVHTTARGPWKASHGADRGMNAGHSTAVIKSLLVSVSTVTLSIY